MSAAAPAAPPRGTLAHAVAFLARPGDAIEAAAAAPSFAAVPALALCAAGLARHLAELVAWAPPPAVGAAAVATGLLVRVPASAALLFFAAVFVHFFARGTPAAAPRGGGWRLFGLLAACRLPLVLALPLSVFLRGLSELTGVAFPPGFFVMLLELWSFVLMVGAVRELYGISTGAALLSFILPGCAVAAGGVLLTADWMMRTLVALSAAFSG